MAKKNINLGTPPEAQDGDDSRTAFQKCNDNFTELYNGIISETGSNTRGRWTKWADGTMLIVFNIWTSAVVPANGYPSQEIDLPTACLGNSESAVIMSTIPTNSNDHFGVISSQVTSPTKIQFNIRNGPVAQAFSMRCHVWTRWK